MAVVNGLEDRELFIRANTRLVSPPLTPELRLWLADDAFALWRMTESQLDRLQLPPPFWAFAWAGGQALARYVLDHPDLVRGKRVLDFASGSGLVAIAAAKAGAAQVEACDIDELALAAMRMNSAENGVLIDPRGDALIGADEGWDVVLAGDIAYERDVASATMSWFGQLQRRGAMALIGDPGRAYLQRDALQSLTSYDVPVSRALEDADIKTTGVFCLRS